MLVGDEPVRERLSWLLAHAGPGRVNSAEIADAFAAEFVAHVDVERIGKFLASWQGVDDSVIEEVTTSGFALTARVRLGDDLARVQLSVEPEPPHRITGLQLTTGPTRLEAVDAEPTTGPITDVINDVLGAVVAQMPAGGMAVGVLQGDEETVVALGDVAAGATFDVGSITKPCTGILLASLVTDGVVALDDPVAKFLPEGVSVPDNAGRPITLVDLVTHSSGLPGLPAGFDPSDPQNPYADFTIEKLYEGLASTELEFSIGSRTQYSNFGFGLLGDALSRATNESYERLVEERIFAPLGMTSTHAGSIPSGTPDLATPYAQSGDLTPWWDVGAILGAGGIRSTVTDLLRFARANIDPASTPIDDALELAQRPRIVDSERMQIGFGWVLLERLDGSTIVWHNGGTYGFRAFLGFHRPSHTAIATLVNCGGTDPDVASLSVLSAAIHAAINR